MKKFEEKYGFPRNQVCLGNWRERPFNRWSFQHVSEIVPSAVIRKDSVHRPYRKVAQTGLINEIVNIGGAKMPVETFLETSQTDLFLVSHKGKLIAEWNAPWGEPHIPHIIFSISKSVSAIVAGILHDLGLLEPGKTVLHYVPEMKDSGFADCTIQNLLDMRVSLSFSDDYLNKDGTYAQYRRASRWNPSATSDDNRGLANFLGSLAKGPRPHGGPFCYLSPGPDVLGLVLESAAGMPFAELMSSVLWRKIPVLTDALITVDAFGASRTSGGISMVAGDLLSLGELIVNRGAVGTQQVVSERWINDLAQNGDANAWQAGNFSEFIPGARYRSLWYRPPEPPNACFGLGIHGQWLFVDPDRETVVVKLSSQTLPQDDLLDSQCIDFLRQVCDRC